MSKRRSRLAAIEKSVILLAIGNIVEIALISLAVAFAGRSGSGVLPVPMLGD
jgi:ABC-type transporter Mla maintaining outer membrane lipid asymmetry permease subunit MlaE